MKNRVLYISVFLGAFLAFWACGDGVLEHVTDDDVLNLEKLEGISADEVHALIEECKRKDECRAMYEEAYDWTVVLSSSFEFFSSSANASSSSVCAEGDTCEPASSASKEKSSSSVCAEGETCEPASSASKEKSSSSVCAEGETCEPASSVSEDVSSSSVCAEGETCDAVSSSSACAEGESCEPVSSSSEDVSSSSVFIDGSCIVDKTQAQVSEYVIWSFVPSEGSLKEGLEFMWSVDNGESSANGESYVEGSLDFVEFKFSETATSVAPTLNVSGDNVASKNFDCPTVDIVASSSSAEGSSSSELPVEGTCKPTSKKGYTGEGVTWTYTPAPGSRTEGLTYEWEDMDASEGGFGQYGSSATMVYDAEGKHYPTLTVSGTEITCDPATIELKLTLKGECKPDSGYVNYREYMVWTFTPTGSAKMDLEYDWGSGIGAALEWVPNGASLMVKFKQPENGAVRYTTESFKVTVKHPVAGSRAFTCADIMVEDPDAPVNPGPVECDECIDETVWCDNLIDYAKQSECFWEYEPCPSSKNYVPVGTCPDRK